MTHGSKGLGDQKTKEFCGRNTWNPPHLQPNGYLVFSNGGGGGDRGLRRFYPRWRQKSCVDNSDAERTNCERTDMTPPRRDDDNCNRSDTRNRRPKLAWIVRVVRRHDREFAARALGEPQLGTNCHAKAEAFL